jgi:hypothetical protein
VIDLTETATINFEFESAQPCELSVELLNKQDSDTVADLGLDKAVIVESVSFFGIKIPSLFGLVVYEPIYPEPWASEQQSSRCCFKTTTDALIIIWVGMVSGH